MLKQPIVNLTLDDLLLCQLLVCASQGGSYYIVFRPAWPSPISKKNWTTRRHPNVGWVGILS